MLKQSKYLFFIFLIIFSAACREDDPRDDILVPDDPNGNVPDPTPYTLQLPNHFVFINPPYIPEDNPLTVEGIALGRKLFFEKKLSKDNSISCGSCHAPADAFNDKGMARSLGVNGSLSVRNAMPLFNLAFTAEFSRHGNFNWDGKATSIEEQAFLPVKDPLEMAETWINVTYKIQNDPVYPPLFEAAFGTKVVDSNLIVKALAQFERTLISGDSKMDNEMKFEAGLPFSGPRLNAQEKRGYDIYISENKGDCLHCHGLKPNPLWTDFEFRNNGLDANPDSGLAKITKDPKDLGKFKTPSLRNLQYTAPYMHDGRFQTLDEVVSFYMDSVAFSSPNLDPTMLKNRTLTSTEKDDLLAFLKAITDSSFVSNPAFTAP